MNALQKAEWAEVRIKGKSRYVLTQGVLKAGTFFASWMAVCNYLLDKGFDLDNMASHFLSAKGIVAYLVTCVAYGSLVGTVDWCSKERAYRKAGNQP